MERVPEPGTSDDSSPESGRYASNSRVARSQRVRSAEVGDERVLLDLDSGRYYTLNATAAWLWDRLESPRELGVLLSELTAEFEIDEAAARSDLETHLRELVGESLVAIEPPLL